VEERHHAAQDLDDGAVGIVGDAEGGEFVDGDDGGGAEAQGGAAVFGGAEAVTGLEDLVGEGGIPCGGARAGEFNLTLETDDGGAGECRGCGGGEAAPGSENERQARAAQGAEALEKAAAAVHGIAD
jgi:hypothetical protein